MDKQPSAFELAADDIIAVVLNEESAWLKLAEMDLRIAHMPTPEHRAALNAVIELRKADKPISDTTVMDRAGGAVPLNWISARLCMYDQTRNGKVFDENIQIVKKHGLNAAVQRTLNQAVEVLKSGKGSTEKVINELIADLSNAQADTEMKGETGRNIADDVRAYMSTEPPPTISTGLEWLDQITGGYEPQMIWWIGGAYKGRKSTLMFLMALSVLMQGKDAVILSREMPRRRVAANMIAMMATAYLMRKDWYLEKTSAGIPLNTISSSALMRARAQYRTWDKRKVEAVDYAIKQWEVFDNRVRVYDTSPTGGRLSDWQSVDNIIKRDQAKYGHTDLLFVDYLQLFGAPSDKTYEKVAYLSTKFQALAQTENLTAVILAQKNEDSIKNGKDSYSAGIKGGGDPAQTADYMLVTSYKADDADDSKLKIEMKLSRHGVGGKGVEETYAINPPSGLVLASSWVKKFL